MMKIRIAGIDPALQNTGLAIAELNLLNMEWQVVDLKLLQTEKGSDGKVVHKSSDDLRRAKHLHQGVHDFLRQWAVKIAVSEVPSGTQSARASFSNGVCLGLLGSVSVPLIEVNPTEVKIASVGHKHGAKEEIIEWAVARWPELPWLRRKLKGEMKLLNDNEHLADACAAIAAGLQTQQMRQAIELMRAALPAAA